MEILPPSGGCGRCHEAGGCGSTLLNESLRPRRLNLYRLPNVIDAQPGESVVVEIPDGALLRAAGWSYLFPVLLILLGAELGKAAGGELASLVGAGLGLALALLGLRLLPRYPAYRTTVPSMRRLHAGELPGDCP